MKPPVIVISTTSAIAGTGLAAVVRGCKELGGISALIVAPDNLSDAVDRYEADALIVDRHALDGEAIAALREDTNGRVSIIGLMWDMMPREVYDLYDACISIYDSPQRVAEVLVKCCHRPSDDSRKELSPREKDVIKGVVKGLSNKEIADALNVSTHTVMTHRRNIAAKLQIHSPAGLTIYAIVSRLVSLDEVKELI